MADRIQFRRDTKERWASINPILMEGEIGLETDTQHQKIGDGVNAWNNLEYTIGVGNISQTTGDSTNVVMSQKAVTDIVNSKFDATNVVQEIGASTVKVMSQKAVRDVLSSVLNGQAAIDAMQNDVIEKKANQADVETEIKNLRDEIGDRTIIEGNVSNSPDEEDLTSKTNSQGIEVIALKDRKYNPLDFSGDGYTIVRKNVGQVDVAVCTITVDSIPTTDGEAIFIINGVSSSIAFDVATDTTTDVVAQKIATKLVDTLTDYEISVDASVITLCRKFGGIVTSSSLSAESTGMSCSIADSVKTVFRNLMTENTFSQSNTIYEIRYDFDLNGETIEVPEGCVLKFEGGTISNGVLNLTNTKIKNAKESLDCVLSGTISGAEYMATDWFILNKDGTVNEYERFNNIVQFARSNDLIIHIGRGTYLINKTIDYNNFFDHMFKGWVGCGAKSTTICSKYSDEPILSINDGSGANANGIIRGISFSGNNASSIGIQIAAADGIRIEKCEITGFDYGIQLLNRRGGWAENCIAKDCHFANNIAALRYKRDGGTESFHGSGLIDCWIDRGSVIEVGENCMVYNAPLNFRAFINSDTAAIINNGMASTVFHGDICVEGTGGVIATGNTTTVFQGSINVLGNNSLGSLTQSFYQQSYGPTRSNIIANASYPTYKKYKWEAGKTYNFYWSQQFVIIVNVTNNKSVYLKTPLCTNIMTGMSATPVSPIITNDKNYVMNTMGFGIKGDNIIFMPTEDMTVYITKVENIANTYSLLQ